MQFISIGQNVFTENEQKNVKKQKRKKVRERSNCNTLCKDCELVEKTSAQFLSTVQQHIG